jgi:hypothetical protein
MILFKKCAVAFFFLFFLHGTSIGKGQQGISYNVLQISEGTNSVGFSEGFGLLLMCCYNQCFSRI